MWTKNISLPKKKSGTAETGLNSTFDYEHTDGPSLKLGLFSRPTKVHNVLENLLKKTFRNNHHEDLELSSLNLPQRNYLQKLLKNDQSKVPFKLPYRDEYSEARGKSKFN